MPVVLIADAAVIVQLPTFVLKLIARIVPDLEGMASVRVSVPAVTIGTFPDRATGIAPYAPGSAVSIGTAGYISWSASSTSI